LNCEIKNKRTYRQTQLWYMVFNIFYRLFRPLHHNQVYQITRMTVISAIEIAVLINVPQKRFVI